MPDSLTLAEARRMALTAQGLTGTSRAGKPG